MRKVLLSIILVLMAFMINVSPALAANVKGTDGAGTSGSVYSSRIPENNCNGVFGSTENPEDFAYYLQKAFNLMKFLGPILVILMSIIDLVKITAEQKQDDQLIKLGKKTLKRAIFAVMLFVLPDLINYIFNLIGLYGTCGIK